MDQVRYEIYSPQVIQETIEGEVIIVSLDSGNYYSLNRSGGEVWQLALASYSQAEIISELQRSYLSGGVNPGDTVPGFLNQLVEHQLLKPSSAGKTPQPKKNQKIETNNPFEEPRLEAYSDMQELLLLDPIHEVDESGWPTRKE